jgi:hypothetical protein
VLKKFEKATGVWWSNSVIDVIQAMALGSGARSVHTGKGLFCLSFQRSYPLPPQVDPCAFASDETVQDLLKEMEELFTARFCEICSYQLRCRPYDFTNSEGRQEARFSSPTHGFFFQDTPF